MKAILLAGGLGTRLRPLTLKTSKHLIPIDDKNLTEHVFEILKKHGVTEVIISLGYMADQIREYFGDGARHGMKIEYVEEKKPMGTASPLMLLKDMNKIPEEDFFMMNADNLFSLDFEPWLRFHQSHGGVGTIALHEVEDPTSYGVVRFADGKIHEFVEKPKIEDAPSKLINSGYYILSPKIFDYIPDDRDHVMMEKDIFPVLARFGLLYGYRGDGQWFDTGTPERYEQVKKEWRGVA